MTADIATVREHYTRMPDPQLVAVMKQDGHLLMPEAFEILKAEFEKRKLDNSMIEAAEQKKTRLHQETIEKIKNSSEASFNKAIFEYLVSEKQQGSPSGSIIEGLVERGVDPAEAATMETSFATSLDERIKKCNTRMMISVGVLLLWIFISLVSYTNAMANGGRFFVFTGLVFVSLYAFFKARSEKSKYRRIQSVIQKTSGT